MDWISTTITTVSIIVTLVALIFTVDWRSALHQIRQGAIPWSEVLRATRRIKNQLSVRGFHPTVIVGIGRSGSICAGLLLSEYYTDSILGARSTEAREVRTPAIRLAILNTSVLLRRSLEDNPGCLAINSRSRPYAVSNIEITGPAFALHRNDRVLILNGHTFNGQSLRNARQRVLQHVDEENVRIATVVRSKWPLNGDGRSEPIVGLLVSGAKILPWKRREASTDRGANGLAAR